MEKKKYKYPALTADALILYKKTNLILIRRKNPPFQGQFALPGGFIDKGESPEQACVREAFEETSLNVRILRHVGAFSGPDRDPRGEVVTIAFLCEPLKKNQKPKARDDAATVEIVPISKIPSLKLAFDHIDIINASGILSKFE